MKKIKAAAFDLDGTIYHGDELIEGALDTVQFLIERNINVFYFTNNSGKTRRAVYEKLVKLGLPVEINRVYNSAYAAGVYLKEKGYSSVYCCGSDGLKAEITGSGTKCVEAGKGKPQAVVVGLDQTFDYNKMAAALSVLRDKKCRLILCNRDTVYPVENGVLMPGCGPIAAAIECAAGRKADAIVGKPGTFMLELLCSDWKLKGKDMLIAGDTYDSDVVMAKKFGAKPVFIDRNKKRHPGVITVRKIGEIKGLF